jgi:large subunit ribosomal protein L28
MARECEICGKKTTVGHAYAYRGLAKAKGGNGRKVTGKTKRKYHPNLQRVRALVKGSVQRIRVCTRCIKSGKLVKPAQRDRFSLQSKSSSEAS